MKCSNCGAQQYIEQLRKVSTCRGCSNRLTSCESCVVGPYCSNCQNRLGDLDGPQKEALEFCAIPACRNDISIPSDLEKKGYGFLCPKHRKALIITSPTALETELKKDNQQLTTSLTLKDKELKDLQAQIRALHTQLTEKENNSPFQNKIIRLEEKLEKTLNLIKSKLAK
jgi:ribosome-associated translation inhibitor RaiA